MKAKTRMLWMKLHAYFACFFLPITLVYITTGMLYFFDIKGSVTSESEYFIEMPQGWTKDEKQAEAIVTAYLVGDKYVERPSEYYWYEGVHYWYNYEREVALSATDDDKVADLHIKEHDLLESLLIVHKGFAGTYFKIFSVLFGLSLAFSIVSGVVITLQLPQLKVPSLISIAAGAALLLMGFFL
ncbi:PepSY domain-containing protein [Shewanella sp. WXL01]|uniref:PepSY domain-containing protein n=1 Tax=Shewanella sp. WXL01 TaxID=2709721 RepID=UPI00143839A4|nr:PepSY domain-containing protein [Shewanella sp. WXL01]NKF52293.1 PepSY domain-containing protein [Shewanella sp. WXL01]